MYFMLQKLQLPILHSNQSNFFFVSGCYFSYISNTAGIITMTLTASTLLGIFTDHIDFLNVPLWLFQKKVQFQNINNILFLFLCRVLFCNFFFFRQFNSFFVFE